MKISHVFTAWLPLVLAASASAQEGLPVLDARQLAAQIEAVGKPAHEKDAVPALAISVARGADLRAAEGFGWADASGSAAVNEHTGFRIGSLTRQFNAVALLSLVDQKLLNLDDGIEKYIPEFPLGERKVSVRQLLANTSGIPGAKALVASHPEVVDKPMEEKDFLALFKDMPFEFEPGSAVSLDSGSIWLVPLLVGRVAGKPCDEYVRGVLLDPLDLDDTRYCPKDAPAPIAVPAECEVVTDTQDLDVPLAAVPKAAGLTLCSTSDDLLTWNRALRDGVLLSESSLALLRTPIQVGDAKPTNRGFALGLSKLGEQTLEFHTGGVAGFRVRTAHYPKAELTIVVLANCATAPVERIERELAARLLGQAPLAIVDLQLEERENKRLAGIYQVATTRLEIRLSEGKLWFVPPGQPPERLLAQGANDFVKDKERGTRLTFLGDGERAEGFDLVQGGFTSRAKRFE